MTDQRNSSTSDGSLYERLKTAILNGDFAPGAPLSESAVGESFGVSRTPVREALQSLEKDGLLVRNGRRLEVKVTTLEEIMDVYDCRILLEGEAARWAAMSRTENEIRLLELALDDMRRAVGLPPIELATINHNFHDRLWRASHNSSLVDILGRLETQIRHFPQRTAREPGRWEASIEEHEGILAAIRNRDGERAAQLSRAHVTAARDIRLRMVNENPSVAHTRTP